MKLEMSQRIVLNQESRILLRQEIKQALEMQLASDLGALAKDLGTDSSAILASAYESAVKSLKLPDELKTNLLSPEMRDSFVDAVVADKPSIIAGKQVDALTWVENIHKNQYEIKHGEGDDKTQKYEVKPHMLRSALNDGAALKRELEVVKLAMENAASGSFQGALDRHREISHALLVATAVEPLVQNLTPVQKAILKSKSEGRPVMYDALVDSAIAEMLMRPSGEVPVRLLKNLFKKIDKTLTRDYAKNYSQDSQDDYQNNKRFIKTAIANAIGQMALVAIGIIDPELFAVIRAEQVTFSRETCDEFRSTYGLGIDSALSRYNLAKQGQPFFFSRYKTKTIAPSAGVDNDIRRFITQDVRSDQDVFLERMDFENKFDELMSGMHDLLVTKETKDENDKETMILQFIKDILTSQAFLDCLKERIKTKYVQNVQQLIDIKR